MRILLLGAGGFIGRHVVAELTDHGHEVVAVVRDTQALAGVFPNLPVVAVDLAEALEPSNWTSVVRGIDVVVNAAGVLRGKDMQTVHVDMPRALHEAASDAGVRRVVLLSAISARPDVATDYARAKLAGEEEVRSSGVGWTILRPSLVYGDGSYGGTSLVRGLSGLPWLIPIPGQGDFPFSPIHVRDLARTVRLVCEEHRLAGKVLEPVGPATMTLSELLSDYREWLGFGKTRLLHVPMSAMRLMGRLGDVLGDGPISTNSLAQMIAGNAGDSGAFAKEIGFQPRSLAAALAERPAQVQDRWHARLFFLAPAIRAGLVILWLASALLGATTGAGRTEDLVHALGMPIALAAPLRIGSSLLDLLIAAVVVLDKTARYSTLAQLVVVLGYTCVIGFALPHLWFDPLGPLIKNLPVVLLILVHGAIGNKR